ncbi:peptide transporter family 1 [Drosophila tropicalis]|uniref:peptide transporter family 1 n=1 Tax=Drosophila tropicalis TaxID=46794 RepID=UPI0035ABECB5
MTDNENEIKAASSDITSEPQSVVEATALAQPIAEPVIEAAAPQQEPPVVVPEVESIAAPIDANAQTNGTALVESRKEPPVNGDKGTSEKIDPDQNGKDLNESNILANESEAEGQQKKYPYPKSVFFIISNEFCERFNYYGMRTVLVLFLSRVLKYPEDTATVVFHVFTMFVYFLCVFGAIVSDSWLGKFKTILYLSLVYICGSVLLTLGAIGPLNLPVETFTMLGLALIALGSGGIKPCVSAFGGDQFKVPEQVKQITSFFSLFYFAINAGSLISTSVTPILREDVSCFDDINCYPLAFGVPAILMIISVIIFVLGRPLYKIKPPAGNMVVLVCSTIWTALTTKCKEKKTNPREHWLDYADKKHDRQLIDDVKVLMRVLFLYLPLPVFWALFDQQGSRWTFQATRMDGDMGSWDIKPDQLQVLNPLLILVFIPLYDVAFYPALSLVGIRRPLQKLTMGGILAGVAFIISGVVELSLEKTYPTLPSAQNVHLRVFNAENCAYTFTTTQLNGLSFEVGPHEVYTNKDVYVDGSVNLQYTISSTNPDCYNFGTGSHTLTDATAWSLILNSVNQTGAAFWEKDFANKPSDGHPLVRNIANIEPTSKIIWRTTKGVVGYNDYANETLLERLTSTTYDVLVDDQLVDTYRIHTGGVYTLIVSGNAVAGYSGYLHEITEPNSMNILWLIPQYVIMTLGEVMFSVTGLEFSYAQAPPSMKSVLQACWLLTVAFGNVIVVIIAEAAIFDSQASEFFLFAGLMFADMLLFMFMAYAYKPNDPNKTVDEAEKPLALNDSGSNDDTARLPLENGVDNKGKDINE